MQVSVVKHDRVIKLITQIQSLGLEARVFCGEGSNLAYCGVSIQVLLDMDGNITNRAKDQRPSGSTVGDRYHNS